MSGPITREIKTLSATVPSGKFTSNAVVFGGFASVGLIVPVINSGFPAFLVGATGSPLGGTDGPYYPLQDKAGALISAVTPGGTGGVALDSNFLIALAGYTGPIKVSGAQQSADATYWWHLKA